MRRALFALLLLAGCLNPDEILPVRGTIDPVDGQVVRLLRGYQEFGGSYQQCQSNKATPFKETQADADGHFGFDLFRIEAQSFSGLGSYCFRVDATFPSGSVAWTDFNYLTVGTQLSRLRDWRASPRIEDGVLHFEPPVPLPDESTPPVPGEYRTQLDHRVQVMTADGGIVWRATDRGTPQYVPGQFIEPPRESIILDAVRLEDFSAAVTLEASLYEAQERPYGIANTSGGPVGLLAGEKLPVTGTRVPVSRGVPCPEFGSPCPLTDGDLTRVDGGFAEEVVLELADAGVLSTVVLRGVEATSLFIDVSFFHEDGGLAASTHERFPVAGFESGYWFDGYAQPNGGGVQFSDGGYGIVHRGYLVISLDAGVPVRKVTLHFPDGLWNIQEISLFE